MKVLLFIFLCSYLAGPQKRELTDISQFNSPKEDSVPAFLTGKFMDDYGIRYTISNRLWTQHKGIRYHIIQWNLEEQYLLAKNDERNPSEAGLYTRIDFMKFEHMEPFQWGFCLTVYNAVSEEEARSKATADRYNPKTGCGGFPFSRMKRRGG